MKKTISCRGGFTLVELMIVVAVIAILASIAIPSFLGIQKKTARSEAKANLEAIALALEGYMAEANNYGNGVYVYTLGAFTPAHTGNIGNVANLGNNLLYRYQISASNLPATVSFTAFAFPVTGRRQEGDLGGAPIWLDSQGNKGPDGAGW